MATATAVAASATVDPDRPPPLRLNSIPTIDLHLLSQSELYSLSKCSNSSCDLNRGDDVVIPKIDRSVFNESAGSRKQTYSRLRLAPAGSSQMQTTIHRRTSRLRSAHLPVSNNSNEPEHAESSQIVRVLKGLFKSDSNFEELVPIEVQNDSNMPNIITPESLNPEIKQTRGRRRKLENAVLLDSNVGELVPIEIENDSNVSNVVAPESLNHEIMQTRGRPRKLENAVVSDANIEELVPIEVENDGNVSNLVAPESLNPKIKQTRGKARKLENAVVSDSNFEELVPIEVENDGSVSNVVAPESLNPEIKHTRGRARKIENAVLSDSNVEELVPMEVEDDSNVSNVVVPGTLSPEMKMKMKMKRRRGRPRKHENAVLSDSNFKKIVPIEVEKDSNVSDVVAPGPFNPEIKHTQGTPRNLENAVLSDSNVEELVPIEVENDSNFSNVVVPESLNPEMKMKRKRGRPRKDENAVSVHPPASKRMRSDMVKKVVVYDDAKDREIMNCKRVNVNLADLGRMEDPYGPEIRRRSEGLSTQDELLGFLRDLKGQWGTTRKKRRVVDASDFGDSLPKGWKLSLCIKRKEGRFWIFCRRYISPSGRQFESCKDVSIYLLSIFGEESLDKPRNTQSNGCDDYALNGATANAAGLSVQEDLKRNSAVHNPSTLPIFLPVDCEKQVITVIVDPVDIRAEEHFKCLKCFLIFEQKVDLIDHQALAHKDAAISDWSIVIGNIFDCRLCSETFYEKNKYNEHIETHVRDENKTSEASEAPTAEKMVDESNVVAETETHDASAGDKLISASPQSDHKISSCTESRTDKLVHDLNMNGDVLVEESGDGIENNCSVGEDEVFETQKASISINESDGKFGSSGGTVDCADAKSESVIDQSSGNIQFSPSANELASSTVDVGKTVIGDSTGVEVLSHAVSETRVQTPSFFEKKDFQDNVKDAQICSSFDELASEKEKVVNSESSSGVFHGRLAEAKKLSEPESLSLFSPSCNSLKPINNSSLISSKNQDSSQRVGFASVDENRFSYAIASSKLDAQYEVRNSAFDSYNNNMSSMDGDGVTSVDKEVNFKNQTSVLSWQEREPVNKETFHIQNNVNNASLDKSGQANLDDFQMFRNNGSINNENGLNAGVMAFNTGKNIEFSSLVPPVNNQSFNFQDDVTGMYETTQASSERGFLDHFSVDETTDDIFGNNIHDLNLAFGNPHALYEDTLNEGQKKDNLNRSVVSSKINDTFDVQTDLSMVNKRMAHDFKSGNEARAFQHNANTVYSGRAWDSVRSNEFRSSEEKKFMIGSGSNQRQHHEVAPPGMWKPAQGNQLQSGLVNPHPQMQSPSFHSFDIMSDKAGDGVYRVDERYNNDGSSVNGLRSGPSGRSEPVEFRFLTGRSEPNPHALQGGSRGFPYNTGMEQAFEPPFWMQKNAMMPPNMTARNMVTSSVCAWCRNVFYLPAMAINPQTQAGVGSLCPNCSAGISGQVNML